MKNLYIKSVLTLAILLFSFAINAQTIFEPAEVVVGPVDGISKLHASDIDEDGNPDLLFASTNDYNASWYSNAGDFDFEEKAINVVDQTTCATTGNLSGNGNEDVVFGSQNSIKLYRNNGSGTWTDSVEFAITIGAIDIKAANVYESDAQSELIVASANNMRIDVYYNLNSATPSSDMLVSSDPTPMYKSIEIGDLDNDGKLDILMVNLDGSITYLRNLGGGSFSGEIDVVTDLTYLSAATIGDFNGNGNMDVVAITENDGKIVLIPNEGSGTFGDTIHIDENLIGEIDVHSADVDNDGDPDLIGANYNSFNALILYENYGGGIFSPRQIIDQDNHYLSTVTTSDIDSDGDLDIIATTSNEEGNVLVYKNLLEEELMSISGKVFIDNNANDMFDAEDEILAGLAVTMEQDGRVFYTNSAGDFIAYTATEGTNNLNVTIPTFISCSGYASYIPSFPNDGSYEFTYVALSEDMQDFAFTKEEQCIPLTGKVYLDENENGIIDEDENGISGIRVKADNHATTYTNGMGEYFMLLPNNEDFNITIDLPTPSSNPFYCGVIQNVYEQTYPANDEGYLVSANSGEVHDSVDFAVFKAALNPSFDVQIVSLRVDNGNHIGKRFSAWMDFKSFGTITEDCILRIDHDPRLTIEHASIPTTNVGVDYVEWVFVPGTAPSWHCMNMIWRIDGELNIGDTLHWEANYNCPPDIDNCPGNNQMIRDVAVTDSSGRIAQEDVRLLSFRQEGTMPEVVKNEDVFSYVVAFVNPLPTIAHNVTVIDTLPDVFDLGTVSNPFSSFQNSYFEITDDGVLVWEMEGIDLADIEEDEINSYGFVQFNVKLKPDLPDGTIIPNKATVYFNGNTGITSSEVIHRIDESVGVINHFENKIEAEVYPNPFGYETTFKLSEPLPFNYDLKMVDVLGKEVRAYNGLSETNVTIQKEELPRGIYFLNVYEENKNELIGSYQLLVQ